MDGSRDLPAIVAEIRERFAEAPDTVDQEVGAFVQDLTGRGFVGYELEAVNL